MNDLLNIQFPLDALLPQISSALQLPTSQAITEALQLIICVAEREITKGNFIRAGELYCTLLLQLTQSYDAERSARDYNGELCRVSWTLVAGLRQCLECEDITEAMQRRWLSVLYHLYKIAGDLVRMSC